MSGKLIHVKPNKDGWIVANIRTETKADAVKMGRIISQRSGGDLVIHNKDGKVQRSNN